MPYDFLNNNPLLADMSPEKLSLIHIFQYIGGVSRLHEYSSDRIAVSAVVAAAADDECS